MKLRFSTTLLNRSNRNCIGTIRIPVWRNAPRIWRDSWSALSFQSRLIQTKPVIPLPNEHGSQVKDQGRRQCCHTNHKKFPYRPTRNVSLIFVCVVQTVCQIILHSTVYVMRAFGWVSGYCLRALCSNCVSCVGGLVTILSVTGHQRYLDVSQQIPQNFLS
jgi:hypothetical protein